MSVLVSHILILILAISLACLASRTTSICCKPTHISFELSASAEGETCEYFGGRAGEDGICTAEICNDGKAVQKKWCGRGRCNTRGCRCKNGCIKSNFNPISSFYDNYGFYNFNSVLFTNVRNSTKE